MEMKHHFLLFSVAVAALFVVSCKSNSSQAVTAVKVKPVTLKDTSCVAEFSYPATMRGIQDVAIFPQVSGRIMKINVKEGQYVQKGDVLFEIDDIPYRAAFETAVAQVEVSKAKLENAKFTLQSKQNLYDMDIISEYQLNLAKNNVATAQAELGQSKASLKNAANDLSFTKVRTMGNGYIGDLPFKVGSLVGPSMGEPLTIVSDNSQIYADFSIPENVYLEIFSKLHEDTGSDFKVPGTLPISMITNIGQRYPQPGKFHSISGLISKETGALPVRAIFPNDERELLSGGSCNVVFSVMLDSVIMVPRTSMKEIQDKLFIFVIKDGHLVQTPVKATRYSSSLWMLMRDEDGALPVKAGDQITNTTNRLKDGDEVELIN